MKSRSEIENELFAVTKLKLKPGEARQDQLKKIMRGVYKLDGESWETLTSGAQDWYNGAAEANKAGDKLPEFEDMPEIKVEEEPEEAEPEKPKATVNTNTVRVGRKSSACHVIKMFVIQDPKITIPDLSTKLKGKGLKVSDLTVSSLRSDVRDTLRVLNELELGNFEL